jgi:hypothetical protein
MTEPEGFLSRWSRRKRDSAEVGETPPKTLEQHGAGDARRSAAADDSGKGDTDDASVLEGVDLSKLPPIESITAATDIRAFLAPGVPLELARAALRRAWVVDPNIRTFIGIAENQWDFTAPDSIPGFGPLTALDNVRRLVADVFGETLQAEEATPDNRRPHDSAQPVRDSEKSAEPMIEEIEARTVNPAVETRSSSVEAVESEEPGTDVLNSGGEPNVATHNPQRDHVDVIPSHARRHGRALPE